MKSETGRREDHYLILPSEAISRPSTAHRYRKIIIGIALTDVLALEIALLVTRLVHLGARPFSLNVALLLLIAPLVWVAIFAAFQLYSVPRLSPAEEFRRLIEATAVAVAVKFLVRPVFDRGAVPVLSRAWVGFTWVIAFVLVLVGRHVWHRHMGRLRKRGELLYRTLIVGANDEALKIAEALQHPTSGFVPVGLVRTDYGWVSWDGLPVLGSVEHLSKLIDDHAIECVFLVSSAVGPDQVKRITKHLRRTHVEIRVSANVADILASRLTVQPVGNVLALSLRPVRLTGPQAAMKRAFDVVGATFALVVGAPIWLTIAVLVKATSRGPVLYKQERVGRGGRPFIIYKFRTMVQGADLLLPQLSSMNEASGPLFKIRNDPRITRIGKWLRKFSLDEVPQLLNVLKGDMSLVGPRPPLPREVALYEDWHHDRLEVRPGITGLWQVRGRSELTFDDYVQLDLFYIENWSIAFDLYILGKTIPAVVLPTGAY